MAKNKLKRLLIAGAIFLVGLIPALIIIQNEQDTRSRAGEGTTLYFEPQSGQGTPLQTGLNQQVALDVILDPGDSLISIVRFEITYDATKFSAPASAFTPNATTTLELIEGPVLSPGKIAGTLSIGSNYTKAIRETTKIAQLSLIPISTTDGNTQVAFSDQTQAFSISGDQGGNILAGTSPAVIAISETGPPIGPSITTRPTDPVAPSPIVGDPTLYAISCEAKLDDTRGGNNNKDRASGKATILLASDGSRALVSLSYKHVGSDVTAVNMHGPAKAGKDGPIAFSLPAKQFNNHEISLTNTQATDIQNDKYYINIKSKKEPGSALRGRINKCSQKGGTKLALTVFLHAIGNSGDSENPSSSLSNKNPVHKARLSTVEIYNTANQLVMTQSGNISYDSSDGNFKGTINIGNLPTGNYRIKVKVNKYLQKQIDGIPKITAGKVTKLSEITLITGDIINDNKVDILDFNALTGCYSDLAPAESCQGNISSVALDEMDLKETVDESDLESAAQNFNQNEAADITDDGKVDFSDLTLFLREIKTRPGSQ